MIPAISVWLLVAAFFGAGVANAIGTPATRESFVRWGYPTWWCRVTGGLELLTALLIAWARCREAGLMFGTAIIVAAAGTVIRHRDWVHLAPISAFLVLLALAAFA